MQDALDSARSRTVLLNDFRRLWDVVGREVLAAVGAVGRSGWYVLGERVAAFERALAGAFGRGEAVGTGNGLDAIEIALRCVGVGEGDRVLTTPLTAFATTLAVLRAGATPVFVDVDERGQLDLGQCREVLSADPRVRCVLPVHLYGMVTPLAPLRELRERFGARVVEDCAQSILATDGELRAGSVGDMAATSFYPTKNLGAFGDGGAVLADDPALAARARAMRNYGQSSRYAHDELGLNSRLDELHAAVLHQVLLPRLDAWTAARRGIARRYLAGITNPHVRPLGAGITEGAVWHLFPILVAPERRDDFRTHLKTSGIETGVHYPTLTLEQEALRKSGRFEVARPPQRAARIARSEVSLPIHPLLTDDEVARVVEACNTWTP